MPGFYSIPKLRRMNTEVVNLEQTLRHISWGSDRQPSLGLVVSWLEGRLAAMNRDLQRPLSRWKDNPCFQNA
jgi:hypothetical protein